MTTSRTSERGDNRRSPPISATLDHQGWGGDPQLDPAPQRHIADAASQTPDLIGSDQAIVLAHLATVSHAIFLYPETNLPDGLGWGGDPQLDPAPQRHIADAASQTPDLIGSDQAIVLAHLATVSHAIFLYPETNLPDGFRWRARGFA